MKIKALLKAILSSKKRTTIAAVAVILAVAVMIALIVALSRPRENTDDFRVYYDSRVVVPYSKTVRDGFVYINATSLAEYCEMTVVGDSNRITLWSGADEYASFTPGSCIADLTGLSTAMPSPAYFENKELWLNCDFINEAFDGVDIVIDRERNKLSVYRTEAEGSTMAKPIYVRVKFVSVRPGETENNSIEQMINSYTYLTDSSKFLPFISTRDTKYLILVNKTHSIGENYAPSSLTELDSGYTIYKSSKKLESLAAIALEAMMAEMRAAGFSDVYVTSAYRDYNYQVNLFNNYINREMAADRSLTYEQARQKVLTYSAAPGTSEHQSGLCVDFITSDMTDLDESFASKPVYTWLRENAHKFGFILRFPEDKVAVTGYSYEPWHYRFVGQYAAAEIYLGGLCLEEYLGVIG